MPTTTAGRNAMVQGITGTLTPLFNNANAHLGVGNSATAFSAAQTDLVGASKTRKAMDATYPTVAVNVITAVSTFGTADANHAWDEVGFFNGASGNTMFSRVVVALGTKTSASTWILTLTHTTTLV